MRRALEVLQAGLANGVVQTGPDQQRDKVHAIGPGALATGHGLASGGRQIGPKAYEAFIDSVRELVGSRTWSKLIITPQSAWVKIEGRGTGERLYVAKSSTSLTRIECTLSPDLIPGPSPDEPWACEPDRTDSGKIRSWVVAKPAAVAYALRLVAGD